MAGDVVNTAARLQQTAAPGAIVVGRATYEATIRAVEYRPLDAVAAKGKREPVEAWEASALRTAAPEPARPRPRARRSSDDEESSRRSAQQSSTAQRPLGALVTLVGEAGIGKSRLLDELHRRSMRPAGPSAGDRDAAFPTAPA